MKDDELIQLWLHATQPEPNAAEIARLAGRASMNRFDRTIFWRNFAEYAAGLVVFSFMGWNLLIGREIIFSLLASVCAAFVLGSLWWQHRHIAPLDLSADARAYHAAMLMRIDKQIHLLSTYRFWYLMPLSIPFLWGIFENVRDGASTTGRDLVTLVGLFGACAWLNEKWGVRRLRAERAKIETLYAE